MPKSRVTVRGTVRQRSARGGQPAVLPGNIAAVAGALDLLDLLAGQPAPVSLAEATALTGLPKPSVLRRLRTLQARGYVEHDASAGKYQLGLKLFHLGSRVARRFAITDAALPVMRSLRERCGETVNLGVLMGDEVLFLAVIPSELTLRMAANVGDRQEAQLTAIGRAMLAAREDSGRWRGRTAEAIEFVRRNGFALDDEEFLQGARCIGAPVRGADGEVRWGISVSGPVARVTNERVPALGTLVMQSAQEISRRLGYAGPMPERTSR